MTPDDFVRSLTPSGELQPVDCLLDQFRKIRTSQVSIDFIGRNFDASRENSRRIISELSSLYRPISIYFICR